MRAKPPVKICANQQPVPSTTCKKKMMHLMSTRLIKETEEQTERREYAQW